jgi:hypothetical protein
MFNLQNKVITFHQQVQQWLPLLIGCLGQRKGGLISEHLISIHFQMFEQHIATHALGWCMV